MQTLLKVLESIEKETQRQHGLAISFKGTCEQQLKDAILDMEAWLRPLGAPDLLQWRAEEVSVPFIYSGREYSATLLKAEIRLADKVVTITPEILEHKPGSAGSSFLTISNGNGGSRRLRFRDGSWYLSQAGGEARWHVVEFENLLLNAVRGA